MMPFEKLKALGTGPRPGTFSLGSGTFYFDELELTTATKLQLGEYTKRLAPCENILQEYGLDWDVDFCETMQRIITSDEPSNFERMQLLKYLKSVVKVPFVDADNEEKTVMNLMYNMLNNKKKAVHSNKMAEARSVYKMDRRFHPAKLRALGYCPQNCSKCLEKRNGG